MSYIQVLEKQSCAEKIDYHTITLAKDCLISVPIHSNPDVDLESQATSFDHYVPPCRLSDSGNGANGFMLISDENEVDLLSHQYKVDLI